MNIGFAIREIRKDKKITQEDLALNSGISRQYIYFVESGKCSPTIFMLQRIAKELGVTVTDLVCLAESYPSRV